MNKGWFCKNLDSSHHTNDIRAVGKKYSYWQPGQEITVSFIGGSTSQRNQVKNVVGQIDFINLKIKFADSKGMIRISFSASDGAWSYVGKECLEIPAGEPTMNLGWIDESVIRHEFGHAFGLLHEHASPTSPIEWNQEQVIKDLSGPPNGWDLATIQFNVLDKYNLNEVDATPLDVLSVMLYPIPQNWTVNGFSSQDNTDFSETDRAFLMNLYPFEPSINPNIEIFKKAFYAPVNMERLSEPVIVRIGGLIGVNTDLGLSKAVNLKMVTDKLFK